MFDIDDPWGESQQAAPSVSLPTRNCIDDIALPPIYNSLFTKLSKGSKAVSKHDLSALLLKGEISRAAHEKILIVSLPDNSGIVTRQSFNIALALLGLAQKQKDISLSSIELHKNELPEPTFFNLNNSQEREENSLYINPLVPGAIIPISQESNDPWSPGPSKTPTQLSNPKQETQTSQSPINNRRKTISDIPSDTQSISDSILSRDFKLIDGDDPKQYQLDYDDVEVTESPERGGIVFKHINYDIFDSQVVRRYNDFFNLSTYLGKKFTFRILPLIPPKGFPVDRPFLDNRLKGLNRFSCSIMRFPYLRKDPLVKKFFCTKDDISKELKIALNTVSIEKLELSELEQGISKKHIDLLYHNIDKLEKTIQKDLDTFRGQVMSLEKTSKYKNSIGDEIYTISEFLRPPNEPLDSTVIKIPSLELTQAEKNNNKCFQEISMNLSNISMLEKSMSEVISSASCDYMRRLTGVIFSMKLLIDRIKNSSRLAETEKIEGRIITTKGQLYNLTENSPNDPSISRLKSSLEADSRVLGEIESEGRIMRVMLYHEVERYRRFKSFYSMIYRRLVDDHIKHHNLMLNAWKQSLMAAESMSSGPNDFIDF
ncbi:hypothetical protein BB559_001729 [Furculomyces boomerangus]|uniref:Sorting nexin MVP1 n=1 Tax=Furculomyces boomerangus TaxID=61424 RepID=A0A2T9Z0W5_9FUNG|nr:hypothetical protein BB559_001729 [Furculomyces boomerangus]